MVLEDAFYESPASGDNASFYDDSERPTAPRNSPELRIDLSQASRPMPIMGPILGFNEAHLVRMASNVAKTSLGLLNRPLTQDELDAVVLAASKYQQWHSWIYANGMIVGFFRARQTRAEFKFPLQRLFAKQVESINQDRLGPLRGPMARTLWNSVRTSLWIAWWALPSYIIGGILGQVAMSTSRVNDGRLAQFNKEMRSDEVREKLAQLVYPNRQAKRPDLDKRTPSSEDDMSPQAERESGMKGQTGEKAFYGSENEPAPTQRPRARDRTDSWSPENATDRSPRYSEPSERSSPASGGSAWERVRGQRGQTESAWDKIRRGQSAAGGDDASPRNSASGDDDSF